jgi:hypothetical protein
VSGWRPLLDGDDAARAEAALVAVAEALRHPAVPAASHGTLAAGEAGVALFFGTLDRARPGEGWDDVAAELLDRAIDAVAGSEQTHGLFSGFPGVAWVAQHLAAGEAEGDPADDPNTEIDAAVLRLLDQRPWTHHFDLMVGLVGLGVYALERLPRSAAALCLERVVDHLAELASHRRDGVTWHTPLALLHEESRRWYPQGYENLGVAHGVPGVITLLAGACAAGVAADRARPLLDGAVAWLAAHRLPAGAGSVYAYTAGEGFRPRPARTAWCYGDPGIAAALFTAARAAGEPAWEGDALALARTAARRPLDDTAAVDAGLCHGAAGLGHLFNRLYQASGDAELGDAARFWLRRALDLRGTAGCAEDATGVAGYRSWSPDATGEMVWRDDAGFLTGAAGTALALLAAVSAVEPAWDRLLLLSIPGGSRSPDRPPS